MTNQAYHHLKAACVKANNETAMCHLDAMWRKELDRRERQRQIRAWRHQPTTNSYAY